MGINLIIWQIRARMIAKGRFKRRMENLELSRTWNLPQEILGALG
jgi:hypothetical protein